MDSLVRLGATESDLRPLNIGASTAWKMTASREHWRSIVDTATLKKSMRRRERESDKLCSSFNTDSMILNVTISSEYIGIMFNGGSTLGRGGYRPLPQIVARPPKFRRTLDTLWSINSQKN